MVKNCLNCKYIQWGYYSDNRCSSLKAAVDAKFDAETLCAYGNPRCAEIYAHQNRQTKDDCKYFKISFWTRIGIFKQNICISLMKRKIKKVNK